jgi:hypothetical protein
VVDVDRSHLRIADETGRPARVVFESVSLERSGPLAAIVRWTGRAGGLRRQRHLDLDVRARFDAGLATLRLTVTVRNPHRALHPGNYWELGDAGSVLLKEVALIVALAEDGQPAGAQAACSVDRTETLRAVGLPVELYQESSGGPNWRSTTHVNRHGVVPMRICGYRLREKNRETTGLRATPVVSLRRGPIEATATIDHFWERFPKALELDERTLVVGILPRQFPDLHELQGGEQVTERVAIGFGPDPVAELPLAWCRSPLVASATPEWYCTA